VGSSRRERRRSGRLHAVLDSAQLLGRLVHVLDRLPDQYLQRRQVHIFKCVDVQASLAGLVLAQLAQQFTVAFEAGCEIQRQVLFAWREADPTRVNLAYN